MYETKGPTRPQIQRWKSHLPISNINFLVSETLQLSSESSIDIKRIKTVFIGQYDQRILLQLDQGIDDELDLMIVEPALVKVLHIIRCICTVDDGSEWFSGSGAFVQNIMVIAVSFGNYNREK